MAQEPAEEIRSQHIAREMEEIDVRKGASYSRPPRAVAHHVGVVACHGAHELSPGAWVSRLRLCFGVHSVAKDADVEAHEGVEDTLVGGGVGFVGAV